MLKTKGLLDQLLRSGQELIQQKTGAQATQGRGQGFQMGNLLSGGGRGMVAKGALGLLLGSKAARMMGGKIIAYGGLAALGVIAYQAFTTLQRQNKGAALDRQPETVDRLPEQEAELHSRAILRALIGAAKADGHIDDRERQLVHTEMEKLTGDQELRKWFDQELNKPLDPADIAKSATSPEIAAEMYLASLLMVDEQNFMERSYLDELARQMKMDAALRAELEKQATEA
jgi:uncharacterized membrane protein YebE (DUF533 family)